jgi:hypothetical protein
MNGPTKESEVRLCIRKTEAGRLRGEKAEIAALALARAMLELSSGGNKNIVRDRKIYDRGEASGWRDLNPPKGFSYSESVKMALVDLENTEIRFPNLDRGEKIKYVKDRILEAREQTRRKREAPEIERVRED